MTQEINPALINLWQKSLSANLLKAKSQKSDACLRSLFKKARGKIGISGLQFLKKMGARNQTHQEIVAVLTKKYKLAAWWQQGVTTAFEIHIRRRAEGRNTRGEYMLTSTKTLNYEAKKL